MIPLLFKQAIFLFGFSHVEISVEVHRIHLKSRLTFHSYKLCLTESSCVIKTNSTETRKLEVTANISLNEYIMRCQICHDDKHLSYYSIRYSIFLKIYLFEREKKTQAGGGADEEGERILKQTPH